MNIFWAITSWLQWYDAFSKTKVWSDVIWKAKEIASPITQAFTPAIKTAKSSFSPISNTVSSIWNTVVKDIAGQNKREAYYKPFKSEIEKIGLTYDDLAELQEEEKQQVISQLQSIWVEIPGINEQVPVQEDLWVLWSLKEWAIGASRVGQYLPEIAGNIGGMVPWLLGEGAGLIGGAFWVEKQDNPVYQILKSGQRTTENIGRSIVAPGEVLLTEWQKSARRSGATTALTLPVGGWYLKWAKWMTGLQWANLFSKVWLQNASQWLMARSWVVWAWLWASTPILNKWSEATLWDIATGAGVWALWWAIAAPVLWKAFKYWQAGYYGGLTGAGKSISRDIKGGVQAITPSGANISTRANRFNANEIRDFKKMTGESPWEFATSRGMTKTGDDAVVEATNRWQASKDQADDALKAIQWRFRFTDEWEDLLKTTIDDLETRLANTKSPDAKRISQLKAKYEDSGLTMSEINEIKRLYSNNYKYSFVDAGSESALRSRNLQDAVRKWQFKVAEENWLTNLKEINKTTQGWKMFADSLSKKIQGSSGNNAVSLTDWIALSGWSPENIALYLGKKLASSDTIKRWAIKLFSKQTKPSIIQASKADIQQSNFQKNVNRGVSGVGDNSGGNSMVRVAWLLPAPSWKATGAKNVRVNQPMEKSPIKNEWQVGKRPWTKPIVKPNTIKNESKVNKPTTGDTVPDGYFKNAFWEIPKKEVKPVETNITRNETIEKWFSDSAKARWDKWDFTMKERVEATKYLKSNYKWKEYTIDWKKYKVDAIDNRNEQVRLIDPDWNTIRVKINKLPEVKVTNKDIFDYYFVRIQKWYKSIVSEPISSDTIPEGYFKNVFWEIQKLPSNKNGGFLRIGSESKKLTDPLVEEARKYKSWRNMYDVMPYDMREKFDRIWVYSLKHFEDFYKKNITNTKWEITMYRWQSKPWKQVQFNDTKFQWNTDGWVFFTPNKDIAKKYWENIIELKSNKNNTLLYKEAEKLQKMAEKMVSSNIKNGITSKSIIEQMALWRPKAFAEYTKKPFLETWDMFWEQWEMIYYKNFDNK